MATQIDNALLRNSSGFELANYFSELLNKIDSKLVFKHLLESILSESIPPRVISVWIHGFADNESLVKAIQYEHSSMVRRTAIRRFGLRLKKDKFQDVWDAAGGTAGLLRILKQLSVNDVKHMCKVLGRTATPSADKADHTKRHNSMTELLKALASDFFPDSQLKNPDSRPLLRHYAEILPACDLEMVDQWQANEQFPAADIFQLCQTYPEFFQRHCLRLLDESDGDFDLAYYEPLLRNLPSTSLSKGLSGSMEFSIRFLRGLQRNEKVRVKQNYMAGVTLSHVAYPLLSRLQKRKAPESAIADVLRCVLQCLKERPEECSQITLNDPGLFGFALRLWVRDPVAFGDVLVNTLKLITKAHVDMRAVASSLSQCRREHRLELLRLEVLHLQKLQIDIRKDDDLLKLKEAWPSGIFFKIPNEAAVALLRRLKRLKPEGDFIDCSAVGNSILQTDNRSQTRMHEILLSTEAADVREQAQKAVDEYKRAAAGERDQPTRAQFAKFALLFATASRSLDILESVILWLRRFNKDALSVKEIYSNSALSNRELIALLSGTEAKPDAQISDIEVRTQHANLIMLLLLETACMALREPSFYDFDWNAVYDLFGLVAVARLANAGILQDHFKLDDEQLYSAVLLPTLDMLIKTEQVAWEEGEGKLSLDDTRGPLMWRWKLIPHTSHTITCRFLDQLAEGRNALWEKRRRTLRPAVVALPEPWTRGLPLQSLLQVDFGRSLAAESEARMDGDAMPFLSWRAENIVFSNPVYALADQPSDEETTAAIGAYVDDYQLALRLYVHTNLKSDSRERRAHRAWRHARETLTESSITAQESFHFWRDVFSRADVSIPDVEIEGQDRSDPILPDTMETEDPVEWNPDPGYEVTKSRPIRQTCLDNLLNAPNDNRMYMGFQPAQSNTVAVTPKSIWHYRLKNEWKLLQPRNREALIAASLLFINSRHCSQVNILADAFPSRQDPRFPPLFLDDEFLERKNIDDGHDRPIGGLRRDVPSALLLTLCKAMIVKSNEGEKTQSALLYTAFDLLKLIGKGDRPQSCLDLIEYVVTQRPDDSSWHRTLLTGSLLKALPSQIANDFLTRIASRIVAALEEQAARDAQAQADNTNKSKPSVKITTVKMLAQIMARAEFIDEDFTIDTLVTLFSGSTHIDVRAAVVESLVGMMLSTQQKTVKTKVLSALEKHAIPVAASLNERQPLSEEDWQQAVREDNVPEVSEGGAETPIADALFNTTRSAPQDLRRVLVARILLPMIQVSATNNRRWTFLFLRKHEISLSAPSLPPLPIQPDWLMDVISPYTELVPLELLQLWADATLANLQPGEELQKANKYVLETPELRASSAGKHWLNLWHNEGSRAYYYHGSTVTPLLTKPFESKVPNGITHEHIVRVFERQVDAVLLRGDETFVEQEGLLHQLSPPYRTKEEVWLLWTKYCRPLVAHFVSKIDSMRTTEWQRNPNREPAVLPDSYRMNLWLLTHPRMPWLPDHEERLEKFSAEILAEIERLSANNEPYHEHFAELKTAVLKFWNQDYLYLACKLGSLHSVDDSTGPSIADHLRIELAQEFLEAAERPKKPTSHVEAAWELLQSWRNSQFESIRMRGVRTIKQLSKKKGSGNPWKTTEREA